MIRDHDEGKMEVGDGGDGGGGGGGGDGDADSLFNNSLTSMDWLSAMKGGGIAPAEEGEEEEEGDANNGEAGKGSQEKEFDPNGKPPYRQVKVQYVLYYYSFQRA